MRVDVVRFEVVSILKATDGWVDVAMTIGVPGRLAEVSGQRTITQHSPLVLQHLQPLPYLLCLSLRHLIQPLPLPLVLLLFMFTPTLQSQILHLLHIFLTAHVFLR